MTAQLDHKSFSALCFNTAWTYLENPARSAADDEAMVLCASASLWHWMQREDCTERNLSVGHWLLSRVYAVLNRGEDALRHGLLALQLAEKESAFYVGYGHEAVARALFVLGRAVEGKGHLEKAQACLLTIDSAGDRAALEADLATIRSSV